MHKFFHQQLLVILCYVKNYIKV